MRCGWRTRTRRDSVVPVTKTPKQLDAEIAAYLQQTPRLIRMPGAAARTIEADARPYPRERAAEAISSEIRALVQSTPINESGLRPMSGPQLKRYDQLTKEQSAIGRADDRARKARIEARKVSARGTRVAETLARAAAKQAARKSPESPDGTCQICGRQHKIVRGKIALHGYQRPGTGEVHGKCWGAGYPAFEIDRERLRWYIADVLRADLARWEKSLARYLDPDLTKIDKQTMSRDGRPGPIIELRKGERQTNEWGAQVHGFAVERDKRVGDARRAITAAEREIAAQSKRLAS